MPALRATDPAARARAARHALLLVVPASTGGPADRHERAARGVGGPDGRTAPRAALERARRLRARGLSAVARDPTEVSRRMGIRDLGPRRAHAMHAERSPISRPTGIPWRIDGPRV